MLAAEHYSDISTSGTLPRTELLEVHRSKISLHHAKEGYDYPTIRLSHTLSVLAGLTAQFIKWCTKAHHVFLSLFDQQMSHLQKSQKKSQISLRKPILNINLRGLHL
jgi:hypothetical protein